VSPQKTASGKALPVNVNQVATICQQTALDFIAIFRNRQTPNAAAHSGMKRREAAQGSVLFFALMAAPPSTIRGNRMVEIALLFPPPAFIIPGFGDKRS
jgi:hypothetical protein